ncbi:MAG: transporter, CydDC cysteine exporter (CydDC-E) family, permease/ATP-binding protein CydC, partial [Blastococcus sp.]|nr:transporter, CydDC cysteine exporter (CydDC-E) family, permease/ATP-binding protein CydC [Blastococcus sp.]
MTVRPPQAADMAMSAAPGRGPLRALAGVPGLPGALGRAAMAALAQTVGVVLLSAGVAHAVTRAAGLAEGSPTGPLLLAAAGVGLRAAAGTLGDVLA